MKLVGYLRSNVNKQLQRLVALTISNGSTYIRCFVGGRAHHIRVQPAVGQVELIGVVSRYARRADGQNAFIFSFPGMLRDEVALQVDIIFQRHHFRKLREHLFFPREFRSTMGACSRASGVHWMEQASLGLCLGFQY